MSLHLKFKQRVKINNKENVTFYTITVVDYLFIRDCA